MSGEKIDMQSRAQLLAIIEEQRIRLVEAEQTLQAIRSGEVDALIVGGPMGDQVFSLTGVERVYRVIVETMNEAALTISAEGMIIFCNKRFSDLLKITMDKVIGRKLIDFVEASHQAGLLELITQSQKEPSRKRLLLCASDGYDTPTQFSGTLLVTENDPCICLVVTDLTEVEARTDHIRFLEEHQEALKASQKETQESERKFRALFENSTNAVFLTIPVPEGRVIAANPVACAMLGWTEEELCTMGRQRIMDTEDPRLFRALEERTRTGRVQGVELTAIRKDGKRIPVEVDSAIIPGDPPRSFVIMRDITERKLVENSLRRSEERLKLAKSAAGLGIHDYDVVSGTIEWDARVRELWGVGLEEQITYDTFMSGLHPEDRAGTRAAVEKACDPAGDGKYHAVYRVKSRADGVERWIEATGVAFFAHGQAVRLVGTVQNITDRKTRESLLQESEKRFRIMADGLPLIVWLHGPNGEQQFVNQTFCEFFGVTYEQVTGGRWQALIHPDDVEAYTNEFLDCLRDKRPFQAECRVRRADREWRWIESFGRLRLSESGEFLGYVGTSLDITERKQFDIEQAKAKENLEEEVRLRTSQLAELVSDLNAEIQERKIAEAESIARANQLRMLAGELTMAEERERKRLAAILHDGLQQTLATAKLQVGGLVGNYGNDGATAAAQIEQLLSDAIKMSRSLSAELSPPVLYDRGLCPAIEWLARMMKDRYGFSASCTVLDEIELPEDVNVMLFQSIKELLFNSIKHSGVSSANVKVQAAGGNLRITVSDFGCGFDPESFSKAGVEGGGFGLFSIRERLALLGGSLELDSAPGRGSCFTLIIPISCEAIGKERPQPPPTQVTRVLLVDDHPLFRDGLARMCKREPDLRVVGYAGSGGEAVALAKELKPDVILMDVNMPEMNGIEATAIIHQRQPEIQIIGLSMYEDALNIQSMRQAGAINYVTKGCSATELIDSIRACKPNERNAEAKACNQLRQYPHPL